MSRSLYLVNPRSAYPTYFGAEVHEHSGLAPAQGIADLATATVAALAPADWDVTICDEHVQDVDYDVETDFVGITGKVTQVPGMIAIADRFRARGRTVVMGGPFASLSPEVLRPHCDVLVQGELEGIADAFFADLERGDWSDEYVAERPDISTSPVPRWDLYDNDRARLGCIQTSRGCPFECEFCDVIQYLGRKQRHKPVASILAELEVLHDLGYRQVFLADDNFTAYRRRAKELLVALRDWQRAHEGDPVAFSTQLSIDVSRDADVMELLAEAGVTYVFIGIETPNVDALRETHKRQNLGGELTDQIQVFLDHGIQVTGGMIVGFDADGPEIFETQYLFGMRTGIPIFSLGALVAPAATPLHERIRAAGRLVEGANEVAASPLDTNIVPARMSPQAMRDGLAWLHNRLYAPDAFAQRVVQMIERLGPQRGPFRRELYRPRPKRAVEAEAPVIMKKLMRRGPAERRMWARVFDALQAKPETELMVMTALYGYAQVRTLYDAGRVWEPRLAEREAPFAVAADGGGMEEAVGG